MNQVSASLDFCHLHSGLLIIYNVLLDNLYCKQYEPRSDSHSYHGSILISVCFYDKTKLEFRVNICSRHKEQIISEQNNIGGISANRPLEKTDPDLFV